MPLTPLPPGVSGERPRRGGLLPSSAFFFAIPVAPASLCHSPRAPRVPPPRSVRKSESSRRCPRPRVAPRVPAIPEREPCCGQGAHEAVPGRSRASPPPSPVVRAFRTRVPRPRAFKKGHGQHIAARLPSPPHVPRAVPVLRASPRGRRRFSDGKCRFRPCRKAGRRYSLCGRHAGTAPEGGIVRARALEYGAFFRKAAAVPFTSSARKPYEDCF